MKIKKRKSKSHFVWRSFQELTLLSLRQKIGKWVAWDNLGLIQKKDDLKMYAPGLIKKVSSRRQVTIYVPSMIMGGAEHIVEPAELFTAP
ncbi:MAG: hypothetical protein A3C79_03085 [Candidatus Taylorbacteria bacterium RIFCSPHIGHO2_02_FULL_45_28]|uniref:Uncharacterized protein n=1 Tax=Candidatus Taylorbacteria bacterium RIFCSPHIGHO2_12_FULL_45_16 TaxID=1802315 RepID=A0A1G2N310_9BACT|nr:MAG: hypothetical protein A2830_00805 [Candidatus Taylorbacteria bacterium RIFCSPHIGHO2_01_FULL_44_110]OHA24941.1 MAG: hypothetical protein A3C79_03085 [Candidatus Taylorbacteria bacterium RIFCSPHIGHO2_02_FULL_45_28]OHA29759.1 MAG: hypothetical protein A3F51_03500 [Candidatus Taylorbacteria bacterium RIFCSPHIGHO2_12_FULL_45_16]OHA32703.1 MAG: hypothetical protein A3A23_00370 [Candidatus Taylorbacteria bacterium RIFCSPLOWO2_01_FULL_45_59]OHA39275.1 MAG: hypothetical protein A3I98_01340 [Candi